MTKRENGRRATRRGKCSVLQGGGGEGEAIATLCILPHLWILPHEYMTCGEIVHVVSHSLSVLGALFVPGANGVAVACSPEAQADGAEPSANGQRPKPSWKSHIFPELNLRPTILRSPKPKCASKGTDARHLAIY